MTEVPNVVGPSRCLSHDFHRLFFFTFRIHTMGCVDCSVGFDNLVSRNSSNMFQSISLSDDQPTRVLKTKKNTAEKEDENNFEHLRKRVRRKPNN